MSKADRNKVLFDKWGIYFDEKRNNWITKMRVKCSFTNEPISRGFAVSVRGKVIGISGVYHMAVLMEELFNGDPELDFIEMLPFEWNPK